MNIKNFQKEAHALANEKGWHDLPRTTGDMIALCHSELSEALEVLRDPNMALTTIIKVGGKPEGFPIELADLLIRVADMAELYGIDLEEAIHVKMEYNRTRPYRHGGKIL